MKIFKQFKHVLIVGFVAALAPFGAKAQNLDGYKNLEILVGANVPYFTPNISVTYDKERLGKLTYGIGLISQYTSDKLYTDGNMDFAAKLVVAGGLHLKYRFAESRNFTADAQLGAYLGYMNNQYVYFPNLKIKESFYLSPKMKLVVAQGLIYYFQKDRGLHNYDPQLHVGLCFHL